MANTERANWIDLLVISLLEAIIIAIIYYADSLLAFSGRPIVNGDISISNLNGNIFHILGTPSPWIHAVSMAIYTINPYMFVLSWNILNVFAITVVPIGMFLLLTDIGYSRPSRFIGSVFYSINPLLFLFFTGTEYTFLLFFLPLILMFYRRYLMSNRYADLLKTSLISVIFIDLMGINSLKYIFLILPPLLYMSLLRIRKTGFRKWAIGHTIMIAGFVLMVIPSLMVLVSKIGIFATSVSSTSSVVTNEIAIVRYEFGGGSLWRFFLAIPEPSKVLSTTGYLHSWPILFYSTAIAAGLYGVLRKRSDRRQFNITLLFYALIIVVFQYGVGVGSFIGLYSYSLFDIFNYPVFFGMIQITIYAICISEFIDGVDPNSPRKTYRKTIKNRFSGINFRSVASIVMVIFIIMASLPLYHHYHSTEEASVNNSTAPIYTTAHLAGSLSADQNSKVLILPENQTTLSYLDMSVPYSNIYGFPYNYQAFASEFPNTTIFKQLSKAFAMNDQGSVQHILVSQGVDTVVVLHPNNTAKIINGATTINGGGYWFASIMNNLSDFSVQSKTSNFIIYKATSIHSEFSQGGSLKGQFVDYNYGPLNNYRTNHTLSILTGQFSHLQIPLMITVPHGMTNKSLVYQQRIFIPLDISASINRNFSNVIFTYGNNTGIPTWLQSINSTGAIAYLKLYGEESRSIDLWVFPQDTNLMGINNLIGEAPQISGTGATNLLPSYIDYSMAAVRTFGYGSTFKTPLNLSFTFSPKQYMNLENSHLTNIAFFSQSGRELKAQLKGNPVNTSDSATVEISFPNGTGYFGNPQYGGFQSARGGNSYNFFYMGFANKSLNLNALTDNVTATTKPEMGKAYTKVPVKDTGFYGRYDNGNIVFDNYTNFTSYYAGHSSAWQINNPIPGYGLLMNNNYAPFGSFGYTLFSIKPGQVGDTYTSIIGDGKTSSPALITSSRNTGLVGTVNYSSLGNPNHFQFQSNSVGWGTNGTLHSVVAMSNYPLYNSTSYYGQISKPVNISSSNFTNFDIYLKSSRKELLSIKGHTYASTSIHFPGTAFLDMSNIWEGVTMRSYYSFVRTAPVNDQMPNYSYGSLIPFQAFAGNNLTSFQNPTDTGVTTYFTAFSNNSKSVLNYTWDVMNETIHGQSISFIFYKPGKYNVTVHHGNYTASIVETVNNPTNVSIKQVGSKIHRNGSVISLTSNVSMGTGIYDYYWMINNNLVGRNHTLRYSLSQSGIYTIRLYVTDSSGYVASSGQYTFYVNSSKSQFSLLNSVTMGYNIFVTPLVLLALLIPESKINRWFRWYRHK